MFSSENEEIMLQIWHKNKYTKMQYLSYFQHLPVSNRETRLPYVGCLNKAIFNRTNLLRLDSGTRYFKWRNWVMIHFLPSSLFLFEVIFEYILGFKRFHFHWYRYLFRVHALRCLRCWFLLLFWIYNVWFHPRFDCSTCNQSILISLGNRCYFNILGGVTNV